jgi:hypothetical protein
MSLSLSPLRRSRVGMKLYFPVHTLDNVNIWKFITYKFEMVRVLLCFLPNRGFVLEKIRFAGPCHRTANLGFDKFLLAAESRDLSQADKSIIRVSSFPKLSDG